MKDRGEVLLWLKYKFFKNGIGPNEFKESQMRDIRDIMDIENAINEKQQREGEIQDTLSRMGRY